MAQRGGSRKGETRAAARRPALDLCRALGAVERRYALLHHSHHRGLRRDQGFAHPHVLPPQGFEPWLAGENPSVDPGLDAAVKVRPVSPKMNSPKYNEPDCIEA